MDTPRIALVGGLGGMGQLLARHFEARGAALDLLDRDDDLHTDPRVPAADIVLLAVPMRSAVEVARAVAPRVGAHALLCDINSLKHDICAAMATSPAAEVVGYHPMFGPSIGSLRAQKIVVCDVRRGRWAGWLEAGFAEAGATLVRTDAEQHDRMMAAVQVLVHFSTIVAGEALRRTGTDVQESLGFTSPIYQLELSIIGRIFAQNADLYGEILMANPFSAEMRGAFLGAARELDSLVEAGEPDAFEAKFHEIGQHFASFRDEAMALSDYVIDTMVKRSDAEE